MFRSSNWSLPFGLYNKNFVCIFRLSQVCYMLCPSHLPWFHHSNNIWWRVQIMKVLIIWLFKEEQWLWKKYFSNIMKQEQMMNKVLHFWNEHFHDTSNHHPGQYSTGWFWLMYSPNLNFCYYFFLGFLGGDTYRNNSHTAQELKMKIIATVDRITEETMASVQNIPVNGKWYQIHRNHTVKTFSCK